MYREEIWLKHVSIFLPVVSNSRIVPTSESNATRTARLTWEQTTLPQLRTWIVSLNLGF